MNSKGARVKIAILDASRRNPFERRFRTAAGIVAPVAVPKGTVVMYAAAPGAVVREGDRPVFVNELIKEIRGPGKIEEAFNRTLIGVSRESKGEQVPWFSSSLVEEFSFVTTGRVASTTTPAATERPPAPPPVMPTPPSDPEADERAAYHSAERIGTKKAFEAFLFKYPSGCYADRARDEVARLTPPPPPPPPPSVARAITELDRKIRANPNDGAAYYRRGHLFAQQGDFGSAVKDFDEVLRLDPNDAEALNNRCWARAIIGELLQPARRDCDRALEIRPRDLHALDSRGFVNLKMGQHNNAIANYDAALRINPKHASALYGRGIAKLRSGNTTGGNDDITAAKLTKSDIADEFETYGIRFAPSDLGSQSECKDKLQRRPAL
jgi:tetratricopeptide (TPR) repeat protein